MGKKLYNVQVLTPSGEMSMVGPVGLEHEPACQTALMAASAPYAKAATARMDLTMVELEMGGEVEDNCLKLY